jgi:hypothetical protein
MVKNIIAGLCSRMKPMPMPVKATVDYTILHQLSREKFDKNLGRK